MAVASLRAQIEAGAQAVQLFDSWAGSLSPDEYARFALPATRAVLEGIADLGVPTILFGVGTGELLALMGSAGSDVVGVDWRVPLDEARRRVGAGTRLQGNLDPALCLAPWPVVEPSDPDRPGHARADGSGTGHVFNLGHGVLPETDPGILAAVVDLVHAETATGMTAGVLSWRTARRRARRRSSPSTRASGAAARPTPEQLAELDGRYAAIGGVSPLADRTGGPGRRRARRARGPRAGPLRGGVRRQAHRAAHRGGRRPSGAPRRHDGSSASSSPRTAPPWGRRSTSTAPRPRSATSRSCPSGRGTPSRRSSRCSPRACSDALRAAVGPDARVIFTAHSLPERIREHGRHLPRAARESARLVAAAAGLDDWLVAWQSAGRTPEPWLGPDVRDVVRQLGRRRR